MMNTKEYLKFKNEFIKEIDDFENNIENGFKENSGSYYTNIYFINDILLDIFAIKSIDDLTKMKILEPCVGVGNYIYALFFYLYEHKVKKDDVIKIVKNIYVVDINKEAICFYKKHLPLLLEKLFDINDLDDNYFQEHIGYNLIFNQFDKPIKYRSIEDVFPHIDFKFDFILTNPPYKLLKLNDKDERKEQIHNLNKEFFENTDTKTINLYKFFVEDIIKRYANENAIISLLIPLSFLRDLSCKKLRTYLIDINTIVNIKCINENNKIIKANQSMCNILMTKEYNVDYRFIVYQDYTKNSDNYLEITKKNIELLTTNNEILTCSKEDLDLVKRLSGFPKLKDFDFVVNLRGELDLSIHKNAFSSTPTSFPLIRGRNIQMVELEQINTNEYVDENFVENSNKKQYIFQERIVCQQIANLNKKKRLQFYYCDKPIVLADSCNFITMKENDCDMDLYFLLAILNSNLINQYFNVFSSNNHINNYEISNLPIPINCNKELLSNLYKKYLLERKDDILKTIEYEVRKAFEC